MIEESRRSFSDVLDEYAEHCKASLAERTDHKSDLHGIQSEVASVTSALIGRQCALAVKFAQSPSIWDVHIGPLVLRTMIDCNITLRWILLDPDKRAKEFIQYGLGLAKLGVSFFEEVLNEDPENEQVKRVVAAKKGWIASQALVPFVEVNLGSWHGSSMRKMCEDIDDMDFYRYSYFPFSSCAHNTWDHISVYSAKRCESPLHKFHYVGDYVESAPLADMMYNSAKYYTMSLISFDEHYARESKSVSPLAFFLERWSKLTEDLSGDEQEA